MAKVVAICEVLARHCKHVMIVVCIFVMAFQTAVGISLTQAFIRPDCYNKNTISCILPPHPVHEPPPIKPSSHFHPYFIKYQLPQKQHSLRNAA